MTHSAKTGLIPSLQGLRMFRLTTALGILMLAACASAPQAPDREIQAADLAITRAEQSRGSEYASLELDQARQKIAASRVAVQEEDMIMARQLAEESRVSAELASARTEMIRAREVNDEMQSSIDTLKQEMLRNTGAGQ